MAKEKYLSVSIDLLQLTQEWSDQHSKPTVEGQFRAKDFFDCNLGEELHITTHPLTKQIITSIIGNINKHLTDTNPTLREIAEVLHKWKKHPID